ncbi:hypothetical protein [Phycicoccus avicenniae]|uniref:hypothetical protein n=1 Tax=Phycicoccus avicenniae TaxID=2828860 RepID=UPI003D2DE016
MTLRRLATRARPDRKGHGLLLMAAVWIVLGLGIPGQRIPVDSAWHTAIPDAITVTAWVTSGALAAAAAFWKPLRPAAIGALILMPGLRAASYITSWVAYLSPGGAPGYDRAYLLVAQQALMVAFVFFVATESETQDTTVSDLTHALRGTGGER